MVEACCTCATVISHIPPPVEEKREKTNIGERRLPCCSRAICELCIERNPRFKSYCPYCQISTSPTNPLPQGLRDPPSYTPQLESLAWSSSAPPTYAPPAYTPSVGLRPLSEKSCPVDLQPADDVLHFLDHNTDTLASLSLRYNVPIAALRRTNNITSDHLLLARRTILIPGEFYKGGVSLSPRPVEGEEEEIRRGKIRKWMIACKVAEYDIAELYLKQAEYDLQLAIGIYKDDERWEKEHPVEGSVKGKGLATSDAGRRRFTRQRR